MWVDADNRWYYLLRRARVPNAGRYALRDALALLDLAQRQNAAVGRQQSAIEFGHNLLTRNR
jgi:hypothetical protein